MTGQVITVTQDQYNMVRGKVSTSTNIEIQSGKETAEGDIYIIPFIAESHYFSGQSFSTYGNWVFWLGEINPSDTILIDYPISDIANDQLSTLWNVSKIFEAANCIWFDPYYIGAPLVSNGYNFNHLFSNGQTMYGGHPNSIELARVGGGEIHPSQFGLIDLSGLDINQINNMSASQFRSSYGHLFTSREIIISNPQISGPSGSTGDESSTISIDENSTAIHTFTANEPVQWSLENGTDNSLFSINSSTGALSFRSSPDYESPNDYNSDNNYIVVVLATDSANNTSDHTLIISVRDVNESTIEHIEGTSNADTLYGTTEDDFVYGLNGDDVIYGQAGNDYLNGGNGVDIIFGGEGTDRIYGGSGHDGFNGGNGNDYIDGGDGIDGAHYSGNYSDYSFIETDSYLQVIDNRIGNYQWTDTLTSIEFITFADQTIVV